MRYNVTPGAIRFNTDSMKLEYYHLGSVGFGTMATGEWVQITTDTPDIQTGGTRGLAGGGQTPGTQSAINYINVDSTGNAIDFGDLATGRFLHGSLSSRTRGFFYGGHPGPFSDIEFVTISSTGNGANFGDLSTSSWRSNGSGCSNSTRGIIMGGYVQPTATYLNTIEYITMAQTGDAVDFGDLTSTRGDIGGCGSSTRGLFIGGNPNTNVIEFVTISTLGNSADFGDMTQGVDRGAACSNSVRGLYGGGASGSTLNTIGFVTISTLGNAQDFGDLTVARRSTATSASPTRAVWMAGGTSVPSSQTNVMDYVQIMSTGNAVDFGDFSLAVQHFSGCSNGHGGLG